MAFAPGTDFYEILGVAPDATTEEIKRAYRRLTPLTHPDTGATPGLFRLITEARDCLVDPGRRADYDRDRATTGAPEPSPPPKTAHRPPPTPPRPDPTPAEHSTYEPSYDPEPATGSSATITLLDELRRLGWRRALLWAAGAAVALAILTAARIVILPVPQALPAAPALTLGDWGGTGGRIGLSAVVAALVGPVGGVWWSGRRHRIRLALGLAAIPVAEFVVAGAVVVTAALVTAWLARAAWRAALWMYWAP